jgi:hypothetical protein
MQTYLAMSAAVGCALCNGIAAVLQKISADKAVPIRKIHHAVAATRLLKQLPYVGGIALDLLAGIFTLIAAHRLPLFLVQALIASSVLLTALLERIFMHRILHKNAYMAIGLVLLGLVCLAIASHPEHTARTSAALRDAILYMPFALLALGAILIRTKTTSGAALMAVISGIAFGSISIIGRMLVYPHPFWHVITNPLAGSLVVYAVMGMFFFTAALQRAQATSINGIVVAAETILPLLVGIGVLGDSARHGLWAFVYVGCSLVVAGCCYIAFTDTAQQTH